MQPEFQPSDLAQDPALGFVVDRWWPFTGRVIGEWVEVSDAMARWFWMYRQAPDSLDIWRSLLTLPQYNSLRILHEWWDDRIQAAHIAKPARKIIIAILGGLSCSEDSVRSMRGSNVSRSRYQEQLYDLFVSEFWPEQWSYEKFGDHQQPSSLSLSLLRKTAMELAAMQRVAFAFMEYPDSRRPLFGTPKSSAIDGSRLCMWNVLPANIGATLDPCRWLHAENKREEIPYYLWDVEAHQTVEAATIKDAQYVCISHTWGRFCVKGHFMKLPGVPWSVPCNSLFRVEDLPAEFATHFQKGYIWLDLFCIPQDGSAIAQKEIARQGVIFQNATSVVVWTNDVSRWNTLQDAARWLSMFYLHRLVDVDYYYRHKTVAPPKPGTFWDNYATDDLNCFRATLIEAPTGSLHPWLTSLWTLQEACLRPDMALCNRQWEPLIAGKDTIITLDALVVLAGYLITIDSGSDPSNFNWHDIDYESNLRRGYTYSRWNDVTLSAIEDYRNDLVLHVGCFVLALKKSRLWMLTTLTPSSILQNGQLRQVSDTGPTARAEAIMSAIGATAWYMRYKTTSINEDPDLVFGLYPLPFVREVARNYPVSFYSALSIDLRYLKGAVTLGDKPWVIEIGCGAIGSMMPFMAHGSAISMSVPILQTYDSHPHASVRQWNIQADGTVSIRKVAYITSARDIPIRPEIFEMLVAPEAPEGNSLSYDTRIVPGLHRSLRGWLSDFSPATPNFAVCLCVVKFFSLDVGHTQHYGILLKQVGVDNGTVILVKVGIFLVSGPPETQIEEKDVNWRVL